MKFVQIAFMALAIVCVASTASAQETRRITIAADSSSGTYKKAVGEIIGVCSADGLDIAVDPAITGGSVGNLDALYNNKVQAAFLHSDVFSANVQSDPAYKKFQTLLALWPEPIHVIALKVSKTSKLGMTSFGKQDFNSLVDVRGHTVGAAGGGVKTAQWLQGQGRGGFEVASFNSGGDVLNALKAGQIAVAIFVGAAPLPNVETLDKNTFKLIPIGEAIATNVSGLYRKATINYPGLTNGPIQTLAPMATLLTRKYNTGAKLDGQRLFRACFNAKLDKLKDDGSPMWQSVEANDRGVIDWYEIPEGPATPVAPATASPVTPGASKKK